MKRAVAVLLTAATVLALAGCSKKEEERKPSKTKKTTEETEESTEEPDTSSETTDTSDTSDTSETSDTQGLHKNAVKVNLDHTLTKLDMSRDVTDHAYGELAKNLDYEHLLEAHEYLCFYTILSDKYNTLNSTLDGIYTNHAARCDEMYGECVAAFPDMQSKATADTYWNYDYNYFGSYMSMYRADEQILSFSLNNRIFAEDITSDSTEFYNFKSATGDQIKFDDVVKDRSAFADAILANKPKVDSSSPDWAQKQDKAYTVAAENIKNGEDITFLLYPNAIAIYDTTQFDGVGYDIHFAVSVLDLGSCVDLSYFGATTKYYSLASDLGFNTKWDFDDDSLLDTLVVEDTSDDDFGVTIKVTLNGEDLQAQQAPCLQDADSIYDVFVSYTDSGYYVYVECSMEDPVFTTAVYHLDGNSFTYVGEMGEFQDFPYDPENVAVLERSDFLGTGTACTLATLTGANGIPKQTSDYVEKYGMASTVEKMVLGKFDANGQPTSESNTVPEGTVVRVKTIDTKHELVIFEALFADASKNFEFQMVLRNNDYDYDVYFNGKTAYELFKGANFYD